MEREGEIMTLEGTGLEVITTVENTEPAQETVSTETTAEVFNAPQNQEELDKIVQAALNREKTNFLKELGVKSVKEFKDKELEMTNVRNDFDNLTKVNKELEDRFTEVSAEKARVSFESKLKSLGVDEQYFNDVRLIAENNVVEGKTLEDIAEELIEGRYSYMAKNPVRIGSEKKTEESKKQTYSDEFLKRYPHLK